VRDQPPEAGSDGKAAPTFADIVYGSIDLDDVTPIYTENLFTMVNKTYAGANALPVALELSRRSDFGAWFDGAYLNRDMVCLGCHNSEFSVTASPDPATNRHYPVPGLFEKALFGDSTGPGVVGDFAGADRLHGSLRRAQFYNDCTNMSASAITAATAAGTPFPTCASGDPFQNVSRHLRPERRQGARLGVTLSATDRGGVVGTSAPFTFTVRRQLARVVLVVRVAVAAPVARRPAQAEPLLAQVAQLPEPTATSEPAPPFAVTELPLAGTLSDGNKVLILTWISAGAQGVPVASCP
jgi:hypothetical protein